MVSSLHSHPLFYLLGGNRQRSDFLYVSTKTGLMVSPKPKKNSKPWMPPVAGLLAGIIGFALILIVSNNWIGAAGGGVIIFFATWRSLKKKFSTIQMHIQQQPGIR